ncbi:MAG: DUF6340 family protein [Cytophagales bacterium]
MTKIFIAFLSLFVFAFSCTSKKHIKLRVNKPATVTIQSNINKILIINRSAPENKVMNVIEGVLSGEIPFEDKMAAEELIAQISNQLSRSNLRTFQVTVATERLKSSSTGSFMPAPLSWTEISSLARKYNTEAVLVLEYFDTDFKRSDTYKDIENLVNGQKVVQRQFIATALGSVKYGLRLYDVNNQTIIDARDLNMSRSWDATGNTLPEALAKLINRAEGTKVMARSAANNYASLLMPYQLWVNRMYFKKDRKNNQVQFGARYAKMFDWENAQKEWEKVFNGSNPRKGNVTYNLALCHEVYGNLEEALKLARMSYAQFGNKYAAQYARQLERRIRETQVLNQQLGQ